MLKRRVPSLISSQTLIGLSLAGLLAGMASPSYGSGFQIFEGNITAISNFGASGAAGPLDASMSAFNPAGLVHVQNQQFVGSAIGIFFDAQFKGSSTWAVVGGALDPYTETGIAQGGTANVVPAFHYAAPISERFVVGFSAIAPFGLETNYGDDSIARYSATDTFLRTIDLSPSFGAKISDYFSLGAGVDFQYASVRFNSLLGAPTIPLPPGAPATYFDTHTSNKGSDWSYGWHAGILIEPSDKTRIGLHYRSQISHSLHGTSLISDGILAGPTDLSTVHSSLTANLDLPATTTLSLYHAFTDNFALMGSVNYTQWNVFKNITLINPAGPLDSLTIPQNYRNTWRFAVGADVKVSKKWLLRMGGGYDQSPTNDVNRDLRLPDSDRIALSFGARYQASEHVGFEFGYTHLFMKKAPINNTLSEPPELITTVGNVTSSADLLGLQVTWDIT